MAIVLYGVYYVIYVNPKKRRRGITIEKYDIEWSDSDGETDVEPNGETDVEPNGETNQVKTNGETNVEPTVETEIKPTDEKTESVDQEKAVDNEKTELVDQEKTKPVDNETDKVELNPEPEAEIETLQVTRQDLADWGIEASIAEICQKIGEQLKEKCLQEVLEGYLKDPSYCRNPTTSFRRIFQKRGNIQQLKIPEDLPLVALHKLHETPEYLNQIHHDRLQVLNELTEKHAEVD